MLNHVISTFESDLARLEAIIAQLENDRLDLESALKLFEEGVTVLRRASEAVTAADARIQELVERADGILELRDFDG